MEAVDLTKAVIFGVGEEAGSDSAAIRLLIEEVETRSGAHWEFTDRQPDVAVPTVVIGTAASLVEVGRGPVATSALSPDGYHLRTERTAAGTLQILVAGNDRRGIIFGAGRLLRTLRMQRSQVTVMNELAIESAPVYRLRGHQLGYRPKNNTYDAWSVARFAQYIRDMIVFGSNAFEFVPPKTDDDPRNSLMTVAPLEMLVLQSEIMANYGTEMWLWYPAMAADYSDSATVRSEVAEWEEVFAACRRLDAVFVPASDPGHTSAHVLFPFLERIANVLTRHHTSAGLWVSAQGFTEDELEEFFSLVAQEPDWLAGVVYGPWTRCTLPTFRHRVPARYPLRLYPDIAHTYHCQFPVPDWDPALARALGREPIDPRPEDEAHIFRRQAPMSIGFITYSEGVNDDVNKIVWTALGWAPDANIVDVLREYSQYFVGPRWQEGVAQGILALERNWRGPLLANPGVEVTLQQFQDIEVEAGEVVTDNWRLQSLLFRAYCDAFVQRRLLAESAAKANAMDMLRRAGGMGSAHAIRAADAALAQGAAVVAADWRTRLDDLAAGLFNNIGIQLSTSRFGASSPERGATLDTIDLPLNDRIYLQASLERLRTIACEAERLAEIEYLVHDKNPGIGGFFDNLGEINGAPHLVRTLNWAEDPESLQRPFFTVMTEHTAFAGDRPGANLKAKVQAVQPQWWSTAAGTLLTPLELEYCDLDSLSDYTLRILFYGRFLATAALTANGHPLDDYLKAKNPPAIVAYHIPKQWLSNGRLRLTFRRVTGRGVEVAALWLSPDPSTKD